MILDCFSSLGFISFGCVEHGQTSARTLSVDKIYVVKEPWGNPVHVQHAAIVQHGDAWPVAPDIGLIVSKRGWEHCVQKFTEVCDTGKITLILFLETCKSVNHLTVYKEDAVLLGIYSGDHALPYHGQLHISINNIGGIIPILGPTSEYSAPCSGYRSCTVFQLCCRIPCEDM